MRTLIASLLLSAILGTCATALASSLGANTEARRVAVASRRSAQAYAAVALSAG